MSKLNKKRINPLWFALIIFLGLANLALLIGILIYDKNIALFNPKGLIAQEQNSLMVFVMVVTLAAVIPTLLVAFYFAWKYRDTKQKKLPTTSSSRTKHLLLGAGIWTIPITVLVILASVMLPATQKLAPQKSLAADKKPLVVEVITLRWKWLFIYPEQQIATVNYLQIPVDTPIELKLTADEAPMSSFWVPNIGGQLYTMTGMVNRLNLMADTPGDYPGSSAELNGRGFSGMKFTTRASSSAEFDEWVQSVKQSDDVLDAGAYDELARPSENNPVAVYAAYEPGLYDRVVMKYRGSHEGHSE